MFHSPFSFKGRIRRSEFCLSMIIYSVCYGVLMDIVSSGTEGIWMLGSAFIPLTWFSMAQASKRCHDLGNSGIYQIIPLYIMWLIFQSGESGENEYGENPKLPAGYLCLPGTGNQYGKISDRNDEKLL